MKCNHHGYHCRIWLKCYQFFCLLEGMSRRSNDASPEDLRKKLKIHLPRPPSIGFFSMTTEQQINEQEELLKEKILTSSRPTASWISSACKLVWQKCDSELLSKFSKCMATCSQFCFSKALQATSGAKLSPAVKRLVKVINQSSSRPLACGDKLVRKLKRVPWMRHTFPRERLSAGFFQ